MKVMNKVLIAFALILLCFQANANLIPWDDPTVNLTVNQGQNTTTYENIPWSLDMVVLDAMKMANGIKFTGEWHRSLGQWMITSIDDIKNQGAKKKNWLLCVNGYLAGVGAGSYVVGPGAQIKWVFDDYSSTVCK